MDVNYSKEPVEKQQMTEASSIYISSTRTMNSPIKRHKLAGLKTRPINMLHGRNLSHR